MRNLPVACTLSPEALAARRAGLLVELRRRASEHQELADGCRLSFPPGDEMLAMVVDAVKAERRCCAFLRFQIVIEEGGGPITLEMTGPEGTREFLAALLAADERAAPPPRD